MLRQLNKKETQKKIWIVLIILILPGFLIWGFGSVMRSQTDRQDYGSIFGKKISQEDFFDALRITEVQLRMQLGESYAQLQKVLNLNALALQRLVLLADAKRKKIRVADSEIVAFIQKDPSFARRGQFDNALYEQIIQYSLGLSPRTYEEMTRQNLAIRKLYDQTAQNVSVSEAEVRDAFKKENEKIRVLYIAALPSDFTPEATASDEEIQQYYAQHAAEFKQPLSFNINYAALETPEAISDLAQRLARKESLEKIAKDYNLPVKETGMFKENDPIPGIGWSEVLGAMLSSLEPGQAAPVEIDKRQYLISLKERKEPFIPALDAIKDAVKEKVLKTKAYDKAREKIQACLKSLRENNSPDPEKTARESGLKSNTTGLFGFGGYIEGVGASDIFYTAAGTLKDGQFSDVLEAPSGLYIITVKERQALDEQKFAQEKEKLTAKLLNQKKQELFDAYLKDLMQKATQNK